MVANDQREPGGYQFTFDHERLWRKTHGISNGDGQVTGSVTASTRTATIRRHWNYDNEGSSSIP